MTEQRLIEALTMAGEYINSQLPDNPKHYKVMDAITNALLDAGAPVPWIAWSGELEEVNDKDE